MSGSARQDGVYLNLTHSLPRLDAGVSVPFITARCDGQVNDRNRADLAADSNRNVRVGILHNGELFVDFAHRPNRDGTIDSICRCCFVTIGTSTWESDLERMESTHLCNAARVEYFKETEAATRKGPTQEVVTRDRGSLVCRRASDAA